MKFCCTFTPLQWVGSSDQNTWDLVELVVRFLLCFTAVMSAQLALNFIAPCSQLNSGQFSIVSNLKLAIEFCCFHLTYGVKETLSFVSCCWAGSQEKFQNNIEMGGAGHTCVCATEMREKGNAADQGAAGREEFVGNVSVRQT